jgi:hypothetical protein
MSNISIPVSGASFSMVTMSATMSIRVNHSLVYLIAAARLSRTVETIETNNAGTQFGAWWEEMRDNAISCLFLTSACLESYANELFADGDKIFPDIPPHAIDAVWDLSERSSPLKKLGIALDLRTKPAFDKANRGL